jgi:hypothetical protein
MLRSAETWRALRPRHTGSSLRTWRQLGSSLQRPAEGSWKNQG